MAPQTLSYHRFTLIAFFWRNAHKTERAARTFLIRLAVSAAPLALLAASASAQSKWIHMRSENLEMYSETTPAHSQETLRALEQVHAFIIKSLSASEAVLSATCVVAFKSEEDFAHFRSKPDTISFRVAGWDRDYVVLGLPEGDSFKPAAQAYANLLSHQLGLRLPVWLEEGLGSFFATFVERGSVVIAGELSPARRKALLAESWVSLDPILDAAANSHADLDQRFALIHMLLLNPGYAPKFKNVIAEIQSGASSQGALEKVYGKALSTIESELKAYAESSAFGGKPISTGSETLAITPAEPASLFDLNLALAGATNQPGRENDVEAWLDRSAKTNPDRPEPWAGLGYLALGRGQSDVAARNFDKSISLGSRDPGVLWARSRIARGDSAQEAEDGTRRLLDREPARVDLRMKLAAMELDRRRPSLAYRLLDPVKDVPTDLAPRFLAELAYAQLETGEKSAAKLTVARLEDRASSIADKAEAIRLKDFLAGPDRVTLGADTTAALVAAARDKEIATTRARAAEEDREKAEARTREKAEAAALQQLAEEARVKAWMETREKAAAEVQEKKDARAREKAEQEAQTKAIADARQRAAAEARNKALVEANEKLEAKARDKAQADMRAQAAEEANQKILTQAREKAADEARQKAEPTVLAKAAKETREAADAYSAAARTQQASNLLPDSNAGAAKPVFPSMLTGSFVELGCGDQIKVVVQTEQGQKNFRIKNPANVIVSGKGGGTVDLNCGPQKPTNVRIQYGPGEGGFDGMVEAIYFE